MKIMNLFYFWPLRKIAPSAKRQGDDLWPHKRFTTSYGPRIW